MSVGRFEASINQQLRLGMRFRYDRHGEVFDPYLITKVEIVDAATNIILETITTIEKDSPGNYHVITSSSWNTTARTVLDKWYYYPSSNANIETAVLQTAIFRSIQLQSGMPTPALIKSMYLKGINLFDENGEEMSDQQIQYFIDNAIAELEMELSIDIKIKKIVSVPEPGQVYDVAEAAYPYYTNDHIKWGILQLFRRPVISVERLAYFYPTGQKILESTIDWVKTTKSGLINIIPQAGTLNQVAMTQGGQYLYMLSAGAYGDLPHLIHIDYTTGFEVIPKDISAAIAKMACIQVLIIMSDAITQGIASSSILADGLSLSYTRPLSQSAVLFQGRIENYRKDLEKYYKIARNRYFGVPVSFA